MRNRDRSVPEIDAGRLLARYFRLLFERQGLNWTLEHQKEMESVVGIIIDAAVEEVARAMRPREKR